MMDETLFELLDKHKHDSYINRESVNNLFQNDPAFVGFLRQDAQDYLNSLDEDNIITPIPSQHGQVIINYQLTEKGKNAFILETARRNEILIKEGLVIRQIKSGLATMNQSSLLISLSQKQILLFKILINYLKKIFLGRIC